jgi:hypothetical protein
MVGGMTGHGLVAPKRMASVPTPDVRVLLHGPPPDDSNRGPSTASNAMAVLDPYRRKPCRAAFTVVPVPCPMDGRTGVSTGRQGA